MTITGPAPTIARDRWDRPLLPPPGLPGLKPVPYTRATTIAKTLDDAFGLTRWKQRTTMLGLVSRRDLMTAVAATGADDTKRLDELAEAALEAGGGTSAATIGTALHAFTERLDRGMDVGPVPSEHEADIAAYQDLARQIGWKVEAVEQFTCLDPYKIAGTADRVLRIDGKTYIGDLKTGSSIDYHHAWAAQLAIYARGLPFDPAQGRRVPWKQVPDPDRALIIHLPAGTGTAAAYWLDIKSGWEAVQLAMRVREWRARKDLLTGYQPAQVLDDPVLVKIRTARTVTALEAIWFDHQDVWTDMHTAAAAARKTTLTT